MKTFTNTLQVFKLLAINSIVLMLLQINIASAAVVALANSPLANSSTSLVLPNLMYVLDDSGSMQWDRMPDYLGETFKCKSSDATGTFSDKCEVGDPPYMLSNFNTLYYNPANTYSPAVNANGSSQPSMTSANTAGWTAVPTDAYGIQNKDQLGNNVSTISFIPNAANTQGYPDRVYCNTTTVSTADLSDPTVCRQNSQYIFPTDTFSEGKYLRTYPYYYTIAPTQYCTNKDFTACQATYSAAYTVPAYTQWCNATGTCQARYTDDVYNRVKWLGLSTGTIDGTIQFKADTAASPSPMSITNVTVNGLRIIPTTPSPTLTISDTTSASARNTLASNLAANINSYVSSPQDYTATASGDLVTIENVTTPSFSGTIAVTIVPYVTPLSTAVKAIGSVNFSQVGRTGGGATSVTLTSLNVATTLGNINIFNGTGACGAVVSATALDSSTNRSAFATLVKNRINSCTSSPRDYVATCSGGTVCTGSTVTITAATVGLASNGGLFGNPSSGSNLRYNTSALIGGEDSTTTTYTIPYKKSDFTGAVPVVSTIDRVDIEPGNVYPEAVSRTDCTSLSTGCSYAEEMTNFANWYAYYRTRMQTMKASTSISFRSVGNSYRVGFITIRSTSYLPIANFGLTEKAAWYDSLFNSAPDSPIGTPLRSGLANVGRIYAGKGLAAVGNNADPVQYSCQQNYALLTTDGYWNGDTGSNDVKKIDGTAVGNQDAPSSTVKAPYSEGVTATNTLADAAMYYYNTDLRDGVVGSAACTSALNADICTDNVPTTDSDTQPQQHMTTFTLGLGVDGTLNYEKDYKNQTSGDFYDLTVGNKSWPKPFENKQTAVDDLWHAAVNGRGTYFSAKNPKQLSDGLTEALNSITSKKGAGAAAATSSLNPVSGDNFGYVASYITKKWKGNLEARKINTLTGTFSQDAQWCVEDVEPTGCASGIVENDTSGNSNVYRCVLPAATAASCVAPDIFDSVASSCKVEIATDCAGQLQNQTTRDIYFNRNGALGDFRYANLSVTQQSYFGSPYVSGMTQLTSAVPPFTTAQQSNALNANLVNYIRGEKNFEMRAANASDNQVFRTRESILGDTIESTPGYNGVPKAKYIDPGYGALGLTGTYLDKAGIKDRDGTVFVGANDGMMHAFVADTGIERWAYVPSMVIPNLYKLADTNYPDNHVQYVNGDPIINDVCVANCSGASAEWRTILVAGLNAGGKGYFALDITDHDNPVLLWEFDTSDDDDLGFSYGNPIITKRTDGKWVVVVSSGYNNTTGAAAAERGKGYLYVLDVNAKGTGPAGRANVLTKYGTGEGTETDPSGLAGIRSFVPDAIKENLATQIYGTDLLGNIWRFDINQPASTSNPFKLAKLSDPGGTAQPITTAPELGIVNGLRFVMVGTGKYLEGPDLGNTQVQSIYAITDDNATVTIANPRTGGVMVQQTITTTAGVRSMASFVNPTYPAKRGWYVDLNDAEAGERVNLEMKLVFGTLSVATLVPSSTVCSPGGTGYNLEFNYKSGGPVSGTIIGKKTSAPIVGFNIIYINGKPVKSVTFGNDPTPQNTGGNFGGTTTSGFQNHRVIWRELLDEQQ